MKKTPAKVGTRRGAQWCSSSLLSLFPGTVELKRLTVAILRELIAKLFARLAADKLISSSKNPGQTCPRQSVGLLSWDWRLRSSGTLSLRRCGWQIGFSCASIHPLPNFPTAAATKSNFRTVARAYTSTGTTIRGADPSPIRWAVRTPNARRRNWRGLSRTSWSDLLALRRQRMGTRGGQRPPPRPLNGLTGGAGFRIRT